MFLLSSHDTFFGFLIFQYQHYSYKTSPKFPLSEKRGNTGKSWLKTHSLLSTQHELSAERLVEKRFPRALLSIECHNIGSSVCCCSLGVNNIWQNMETGG